MKFRARLTQPKSGDNLTFSRHIALSRFAHAMLAGYRVICCRGGLTQKAICVWYPILVTSYLALWCLAAWWFEEESEGAEPSVLR